MKRSIQLIGILLLFATFLVFSYIFIVAYLNPDKSVLVLIDSYREANIEMFIVLPVTFLFGLVGVIITMRDYIKSNGE